MKGRTFSFFPFLVLFCVMSVSAVAQPTWTFDPFGKEKKPKEYEEKILPSEKTADKKFTKGRRFSQNTLSHYNYFFNANNKLNLVIDRARTSQVDDYTQLLSFYPYSLDNTASQQIELDSVIYKATGGILLHDLRSDWVDNMYLLIGKSYYYRKLFDSAALTFQFINYNLFPRKKDEDDNRIVGANSSATSTKLSIADREKRNIIQRTFSLPPSRNDALIWLARTYVEANMFGESAGLINILQEDPNLPKRLKDDLNQVTAYWYFKQEGYDSAAVYLEKGLSTATNKIDVSRWNYLLGQLYEMNGTFDKASDYFNLAAKNTVDPLMDIYSRLNNAKMVRKSGDSIELNKNIATLLSMAKKDKYESYRDIIFHSVGLINLKKVDTTTAIAFFEKSLTVNQNNAAYKNKSHLQLGKIAYERKEYKIAADHYDSLDVNEPSIKKDSAEIADRKPTLRRLADQLIIIDFEDSLQMIAALSPLDRDAFIKKLSKKLRKDAGIKEEVEVNSGGAGLNSFDNGKNNPPMDLFATSAKGDWYFYNASMKSKGYSEFKSNWGKRDNVDNWRRKSAMKNAIAPDVAGGLDPLAPAPEMSSTGAGKPVENSYDDLMLNVPTTPEKLDSSNTKIATALLTLAAIFQNELQDYEQAIYTYEIYLQRFPEKLEDGEVYLGLYYCYNRIGNSEKAAYYKNLLDTKFAESRSAKMLNDPLSLQPDQNNPIVSRMYQNIYDLFIQGGFDSAIVMKKTADSIHGNNYWTPQLTYIEAIYYVQCEQDTDAILKLDTLIKLFPTSPLSEKAKTLIDVLKRRKEIEAYLSSLEITRAPEDDKILIADNKTIETKKAVAVTPSAPKLAEIKPIKAMQDAAVKLPPSMLSGEFKWQPAKQHNVIMLLDKVDEVYVTEVVNAYKRYNTSNGLNSISVSKLPLNAQQNMVSFSKFENAEEAILYFEKIKRAAPTQVSWLQASKYSFFIINDDNLQLLKTNKALDKYKQLLNNQYPGKF
jgi:tetratricopeptide (TPR) repeat protein